MKAAQTIPTRPGFTLVELLAVIGIIALLAALVAGGVVKVRNAQMQRNAEQTLIKLQITLGQQWKALADKVGLERGRGKIDPKLTNFCTVTPTDNKELDRAAALYLYMLTRNEFPQNFAEATAAVNINGFNLPARKVFGNVGSVATGSSVMAGAANGGRKIASTVTPEIQGAVLLYLILAEKSLEGTTFNADDATQSAQAELFFTTTSGTPPTISFRVFTDPWGTPITFTRYTQTGFNGELNSPPYIQGGTNRDPLDPKNLLSGWASTTNGKAAQMGLNATVYNGAYVVQNGSSMATQLFDGTNKQPSAFSAGANLNAGTTPGEVWASGHADGLFGGDNLAGYRLMREGAKGD